MTLLFWVATGRRILGQVLTLIAKCRRERKFSISATPMAECRRVLQHFGTAVSIGRKVLQNQNSATLATFCDTLRFNGNQALDDAALIELSPTNDGMEDTEPYLCIAVHLKLISPLLLSTLLLQSNDKEINNDNNNNR